MVKRLVLSILLATGVAFGIAREVGAVQGSTASTHLRYADECKPTACPLATIHHLG